MILIINSYHDINHINSCAPGVGAKDYTSEIAKMKLRWKMPLNIHWEIPVKSTGKVTILLNMPLKNESPLENATENPLENATGNPPLFLRCRFLVCNLS